MKQILEKILNQLRRQKEFQMSKRKSERHFGLCHIAYHVLTEHDQKVFNNFLKEAHKDQTIYFVGDDSVTNSTQQFHWKKRRFDQREKWLLKSIKEL